MQRGIASAFLLAALLTLPFAARAQQSLPANGLLLVAKPSLADPNFARTVVLVTHEPDVAQHAGRILTFRDGRVVGWEASWLHRSGGRRQVSISAEMVEVGGE